MEKTCKPRFTRGKLVAHFFKGSKIFFALAIISSFVTAFLGVVVPQIISFTIDCVLGDKAVESAYVPIVEAFGGPENLKVNIWIIAVLIISVAVVCFIFQYSRNYFNTRANHVLIERMQNELFTHIQRLPVSWHSEHKTGDVIQRCTTDISTISNFISRQLINLVLITFMMTLSIVFMFLTHSVLALIALAFVPVLLGSSLLFHFFAKPHFAKCEVEEGVLSTYAQENLTGVRVVRAFGKENYEREKFTNHNNYYSGLWVRLLKFMALYWTVGDAITAIQLMLVIVMGSVFCVNGTLTVGEFVAFISYNTMMINPVRQLGRIISNLSKSGVALDRIGEIMNADEEEYGEAAGELSGDIEFENVSFAYDGQPVLRGVSFKLKEGGVLGIIGGTASGKSTLVHLLLRLYPPTEGRIIIGGKDIAEIPPALLRKNIGLILQEGYIYSRSLGENIAICNDGYDLAAVREATDCACLDEDIISFADGYDTVVGERGVTLSGGQKQRLAIARTLIRRTPYVIFDDSLSAVDSETDAKIRENLSRRVGGLTQIIISHRITTVAHADEIIVLDGGRIVESGSPSELLERDGVYKKLHDLQMSLPDDIKEELINERH